MSHSICRYIDGECEDCASEAWADANREIQSQRGRWMVVQDDGTAYRYTRKSRARRHVRMCDEAGIRAWLRRWSRDRVVYVYLGYEVSDDRWRPKSRREAA